MVDYIYTRRYFNGYIFIFKINLDKENVEKIGGIMGDQRDQMTHEMKVDCLKELLADYEKYLKDHMQIKDSRQYQRFCDYCESLETAIKHMDV